MTSCSTAARAVALLAAAALVAAGCGSEGDASPDSSEAAISDASGEESGADVELSVWSFHPLNFEDGEAVYQGLVDSFEAANPDIAVDFVSIPYDAYWDQLRNATIAGTGPDVVAMYGGTTAAGYPGSLLPLQDALDPAVLDGLAFVDSSIGPDGNLYAVPVGAFGYFLTVNTELLADAGLDVSALASWDGMLEACATLAAAGVRPFSTGWSDGYQLETFLYMMMSQILDADGFAAFGRAEIGLDDPRFQTAIERVLDMRDAGCFPEESLGLAMFDDAFAQITAGDAAIFTAGSADTAIEAAENLGDGSIAVVPFPMLPESQYDAMVDAGPEVGWSVTSWTEHEDEAIAFVEHMVGDSSQQVLWDSLGIPPNARALDVTSATALMADYLALLKTPDAHTTFMAFTQPALAIFEREASNLIAGRIDAAEVLALADAAQQRALADLGN